MGLQTTLEAEVDERRARSCCPAACSPRSSRSLGDATVEIELREAERDVEIRSGGSSFHLRVLPAEDFPKLPERAAASR